MLNSSGLPQNMWGEALLTTNFILNRIPQEKTNKSAYELWNGKLPTYKMLKVWGCLAKVQVPLPKRTKLGPKTVDCVFIGYALNSAAYRFLVVNSQVSEINNNTIMESIEAEFFEDVFPYNKHQDTRTKRNYEASTSRIQDGPESEHEQETDHDQSEPRRSKKVKQLLHLVQILLPIW